MQLAAATLSGSCFSDSTWNPTIAATDQSVLSGVLAGFVFAGIVAVLGVRATDPGKEAARAVLEAVAAHREEFEFTEHCTGPNMDATPKDIIGRLESYCGLQLADAFAIPNLDRVIKWHTKYARQNGIHTSPTFMIDGLVQPDLSSGDKVSDWVSRLLAN